MDGKTTAIVSHITLIGWIIAFVTNNDKKDPLASFYIRQTLGLMLTMFCCGIIGFIPLLGLIVFPIYLVLFVFWIISLINAASGKMQTLPVIGDYFQDWFKSVA